jgi:hypothetical protein
MAVLLEEVEKRLGTGIENSQASRAMEDFYLI